MAYEELREKGLVEDVKPNFQLVNTLIVRALKDLTTARANVGSDREWAYAIAYQGMQRAARAMITAEGVRPRGRDQQRTIVQLTGAILGDEWRDQNQNQSTCQHPGAEVPRRDSLMRVHPNYSPIPSQRLNRLVVNLLCSVEARPRRHQLAARAYPGFRRFGRPT